MYDQSFSPATLGRLVRKTDFREFLILDDSVKNNYVQAAFDLAHGDFSGWNPLVSFAKRNKTIFRLDNLPDELVLRKVTLNLRRVTSTRQPDRQMIVSSLRHLLAEGTPFRVYRLDINSFYESFTSAEVLKKIDEINNLSPQTKRLIYKVLSDFSKAGGLGIPRGLALSAVASELMMTAFDTAIINSLGVFFYARYVDDIVIVTHALENTRTFLRAIVKNLPTGLTLNEAKQRIRSANMRVSPSVKNEILFSFSYLGYEFFVKEPLKDKAIRAQRQFRHINIDISKNKITRYKTRICRSFLDFTNKANFELLRDRLRFLTSNFSVRDLNTGRQKLAGIFFNYPYLTSISGGGLEELDKFLRDAIRGSHGRLFSRSAVLLSKPQKRELLALSFRKGHENRTFRYFHPKHISSIQECWANE